MNKKSAFAILLSLTCLAPLASAQTTTYLIEKEENYNQNVNSTAPTTPDAFRFHAEISGGTQDISTPPQPLNIVTPIGGAGNVALVFNSGSNQWRYNGNFTNQNDLDGAFPNGTYQFNLSGNVADIALNGDLYPNIPLAIGLSGGTWFNGTYYVTPGANITINSNAFTTNYVSGDSRISIEASGQNNNLDLQYDSLNDPIPLTATSGNLTIPGADLISGNIFNLQLEFDAISTFTTPGLNGGQNVGLYATRTNFNVQAGIAPIPEPAETVLIAGVVGLSAVGLWRRKRA